MTPQRARPETPLTARVWRHGMRDLTSHLVRQVRPSYLGFLEAAANPRHAQARRLKALVRANRDTTFGRRHGLDAVDSVAAFQRRVPVCDAAELERWTCRAASGHDAVLTKEPVLAFERTGGTTEAGRLIPFTSALLCELTAAAGPWLHDLYASCAGLQGTRAYWSISPVTRGREYTVGGTPVGLSDDSEYFGPALRRTLGRLMVAPPSLAHEPDMSTWRRQTCQHLLAADDLGLISVWSPTFLIQLMEHIAADLDGLLGALPAWRAKAISGALDAAGGELSGELLWPALAVISCWADGASEHFLPALRRWFPRTTIQPKGLLATEGVVSFPLMGQAGAVLAVGSHFLEFEDLDHPGAKPLLAHQLRQGGCYSPLLTTGAGLYRYHLKDQIRCVGRFRSTPLVRFEGKLDGVSDLCGEKLSPRLAERALRRALSSVGTAANFCLLVPRHRSSDRSSLALTPRYQLYIETNRELADLATLEAAVERELCRAEQYARCRDLGQLGSVRAYRVHDGWPRFQAALLKRGRRLGEIKPAGLDTLGVAAEAFGGGAPAMSGGRS